MKRPRLSFCATLLAAVCGTAVSLVETHAVVSRTLARDIAQSSPEAIVRQVALGSAEPQLLAHVDFEEAARLAVGSLWTQASVSEQRQLTAAFRRVMIRGYLQALEAHAGQRLVVLPPQATARSAEDITVQSRLEGRDGAPLAVEYALRRRGGEWKIYDIRIDGESLVDACRPLFERIARAEGIGGLIKRMKGNARARPALWA